MSRAPSETMTALEMRPSSLRHAAVELMGVGFLIAVREIEYFGRQEIAINGKSLSMRFRVSRQEKSNE